MMFLLPDRHFHNFWALESVPWRLWTTQSSPNSWYWGSRIMNGPVAKSFFQHLSWSHWSNPSGRHRRRHRPGSRWTQALSARCPTPKRPGSRFLHSFHFQHFVSRFHHILRNAKGHSFHSRTPTLAPSCDHRLLQPPAPEVVSRHPPAIRTPRGKRYSEVEWVVSGPKARAVRLWLEVSRELRRRNTDDP